MKSVNKLVNVVDTILRWTIASPFFVIANLLQFLMLIAGLIHRLAIYMYFKAHKFYITWRFGESTAEEFIGSTMKYFNKRLDYSSDLMEWFLGKDIRV